MKTISNYFSSAIFIVLFIIISTSDIFSQKPAYPFDKWTKDELNRAATYKGVNYFNPLDTAVLFYCNLVRINPKLFQKTYLSKFIQDDSINELQKSLYVKSLLVELAKTKKGNPLYPEKDLTEIAIVHADFMGKKGKTGHDNYDKRFKVVASKYTSTGENCDYGNDEALEIVMSLLIDQNVSNLGHRKNILSRNFNSYGGSLKEHVKYKYNYVMCFGYNEIRKQKRKKKFIFF
jgi:uncharacterized protein YkwD